IAVLLIDLGLERPHVAETVQHEFFSRRPPATPRTDARVFHQADWYGATGIARSYFDRPEMYWVIRNGVYPHVGSAWGLQSALNRDIDQTALLPTADLLQKMHELRGLTPHWFEPLMAMSNAGYRAMYLPAGQAGSGPSIRPIIFVPAATNPRFYFADGVAPSRDFVSRLSTGAYTRRIVFTDTAFTPASGEVLNVALRSNAAHLRVRSEGDALLVCSITRHKYWRATIDGVRADLIPANIAYQALRVPRGVHEIELRYDNPLLRWFGVVSLIALIAVAILAMIPERDRAQL
ncbi:MAG TPA: hypothetical protein VGS96_21055, partial [Thermoanaerobaculia bacterium]|nr:hypothetical protein [Thermoanaerobaculia bacterium]